MMELAQAANAKKASVLARFFKSGPGEYAEGDQFVGVTVPQQRLVAKRWSSRAKLTDISELLASPVHEHRLTGLLILTYQYPKASTDQQSKIVQFYLKQTKTVNNWDLVDSSAHQLLGEYLLTHPQELRLLDTLASSDSLWENRIAMIASYAFIKQGQFDVTIRLATRFLHHPHDLMHKAVGWMLREVGKKELSVLKAFLEQHRHTMPRTMLRYAIERLTPNEKEYYLGRKDTC